MFGTSVTHADMNFARVGLRETFLNPQAVERLRVIRRPDFIHKPQNAQIDASAAARAGLDFESGCFARSRSIMS